MADEQIIYLSPEEELTNVRERLERISTRRIILVVPTQTQLRSHVSWRLLHARARELDKDVLIVSSDRQIRSVVKAAGFKVADSLESPPTSKARPASRPTRSSIGGKTSARLRTPPGKTTSRQQSSEVRREDTPTAKAFPPAPSTFQSDEKEYGPDFDYSIGSSPSVRPTATPFEDEEPDPLLEDYQQSQSIRQAAQKNDADMMTPPAPHAPSPGQVPPIIDLPAAADEPDGPFTYLEEDQEAQLPEQRAAAFTSGIVDDHVPDIADYPTDTLNIEDQGDQGDIVQRPGTASQGWSVPAPEEDEDIPGPSRIHGIRPRTNRSGRFIPPPLPPSQDFDDEDDVLPPVEEPVFPPPPTARQSGTLSPSAGASNRSPKPVSLPQPRSTSARTTQPPPKKRPAPPPGSVRPVRKPPTAQPRQTAKQSSRGNVAVPILVGVLILLLIGLLGYLLPSADVTVTLPSQSYSLAMKLTASAASRQDVVRQTLPAQTLLFNTSTSGTGKATGSTTVGTVPADGLVYFTNNGKDQVLIPSGIIVATKNNVLFTTQAEVLVQPQQTLPTDIQAQNPGVSGNVPANAITVIPPESLAKLQQANPGTSLNVTVTNPDPTQHGGAGNATTVTANDVNAEKKNALDAQIQQQITDYLAKQVHDGDQLGKPVLDETMEVNPAVGSMASSGTFTETLKVRMSVLVVRAADLQAAAMAQMKAALSKQKSGMSLVPQQTVQLKQVKNTPAKDGSSLVLAFTAWGQVAPQISEETVRTVLSGKRLDQAKTLLNGKNGTPAALDTQIKVSPSFFTWVPFWAQRISVHFKTVPQTPAPAPKPKHGKR